MSEETHVENNSYASVWLKLQFFVRHNINFMLHFEVFDSVCSKESMLNDHESVLFY